MSDFKEMVDQELRSQGLPTADELQQRITQFASEARKHRDAFREYAMEELNDPLDKPSSRVHDIEFGPDQLPIRSTQGRYIYEFRDKDGNVFYTREGGLSLQQVRVLREKVVSERQVYESLPTAQKTQLKDEWTASGGKTPIATPLQDFFQSDALGVRFTDLFQNPPSPYKK